MTEQASKPSAFQLLAEGIKNGTPTDVIFAGSGGGTGGAPIAGMFVALEQVGARPATKAVKTASVSSIMGAYFAAGQAHEGVDVFKYVSNREFFDPFRLPPVSVRFITHTVMRRDVPLNWKEIVTNGILKPFSTGSRGEPLLPSLETEEDVFDAILASAQTPHVSRRPVRGPDGRSRRHDGCLGVGQIPLTQALADSEHVIALLGRPAKPDETTPTRSFTDQLCAATYAVQGKFALARRASRLETEYANHLRTMRERGIERVQISADNPRLGIFERRFPKIIDAVKAGYDAMMEKLEPYGVVPPNAAFP